MSMTATTYYYICSLNIEKNKFLIWRSKYVVFRARIQKSDRMLSPLDDDWILPISAALLNLTNSTALAFAIEMLMKVASSCAFLACIWHLCWLKKSSMKNFHQNSLEMCLKFHEIFHCCAFVCSRTSEATVDRNSEISANKWKNSIDERQPSVRHISQSFCSAHSAFLHCDYSENSNFEILTDMKWVYKPLFIHLTLAGKLEHTDKSLDQSVQKQRADN